MNTFLHDMSLLTQLARLIPPTFRPNYCPTSWQELANDLVGGTQLTFLIQQGNYLYNYGSSTPSPENRIYPWLNTTDGLWYNFQFGLWTSPHPITAGSDFRLIWVGSSGDLDTADGGTAGAVTATTGPFWSLDASFDGRALIGAGTIPGTSPARTLTVNGTSDSSGDAGSWVREITRALLPNERLKLFANTQVGEPLTDIDADGIAARYADVDSEKQSYRISKASAYTDPTVGNTDALGQGQSFVQAPPFIGIYLAKRTARVWKTRPA